MARPCDDDDDPESLDKESRDLHGGQLILELAAQTAPIQAQACIPANLRSFPFFFFFSIFSCFLEFAQSTVEYCFYPFAPSFLHFPSFYAGRLPRIAFARATNFSYRLRHAHRLSQMPRMQPR